MHFGAFSGFPAKGRKVNPRVKSQLVVNPDFRASTSQHEVPEVSRKRIPEHLSRNREVKQSQPWSTPKVKVQVKVNFVTHPHEHPSHQGVY